MRVVIADDSALFRAGLVRVLEDAGVTVTGEARDGAELIALIAADQPDVVIVDIRMPPTMTDEGLDAAREIHSRWPQTGVLVLSTYVDTTFATELVAGAERGVGYLLKDRVQDADELVDALARLHKGGSVVDTEVVARLIGRRRAESSLDQLSEREREILALMAQGRSNQAISARLHLSERTVESHIGTIFSKLGLEPAADDHRRVMAVLRFLGRL